MIGIERNSGNKESVLHGEKENINKNDNSKNNKTAEQIGIEASS
jgi:hypothetical protein